MKISDVLTEGPNDPHIFKAIFLAGGPGSGKSFVSDRFLKGTGLRVINSDDIYEYLMGKQGLGLDPETIFSPQGQETREKAKAITGRKQASHIDGRLGLVIDGTGKDVAKYSKTKKMLEDLGYETMMLFVNTSLDVAQQRNQMRPRKLDPRAVEKMWRAVQDNIGSFQSLFGAQNFFVVDNSGGLEDPSRADNFARTNKAIARFLNTPPRRPEAKRWLAAQRPGAVKEAGMIDKIYLGKGLSYPGKSMSGEMPATADLKVGNTVVLPNGKKAVVTNPANPKDAWKIISVKDETGRTFEIRQSHVNLAEDITQPQLNALEAAIDRVFGKLGIDVEFTRHFLDRVNDDRNGEPITLRELGQLFAKEYKRWGRAISQMPVDSQAVMKDLSTAINIPFVLNRDGKEKDLVAKTVMRKRDFKTPNKTLPVESVSESLNSTAADGKWTVSDEDMSRFEFTASNNVGYEVDFIAPFMGPDEIHPTDFFPDMSDEHIDQSVFVEFAQTGAEADVRKGVAGTGAAAEVFGIVTNAILDFARKRKPAMIYFQAAEPNRRKLYAAITKRLTKSMSGYVAKQQGDKFAVYHRDLAVTNEATRDEEEKFHQELDKLVHRTFGRSKTEKRAAKEGQDPNQLKGRDRARPVKPNPTGGSQPHPFRGKLVGGT